MTDEEILALAEKTKKEKYCKRYLRDSTEKPYECDLDCPFNYDGMNCEDEHEIAFLDGFKAAMELVKNRAAEVKKWYENNNDISYEEGGKDALIDLLEAIER